jgi:hypothetical protein
MKTNMQHKFGDVDLDELRMKINFVKHELQQRVQLYFDMLDKLFRKRKIKHDEQRRCFLVHLQLKIKNLCMVRMYINVEEILVAAKDVEKVYGELGEMSFEPFKEE